MCRQHDKHSRQTQDECEKYEWDDGRGLLDDRDDDEIEGEGDSGGEDERANEFDEDDELHAEAEGSAEVPNKHQLHEIVYGAVDPSPALGKQDRELLRYCGFADGLGYEDLFAFGECLEHEGREVAVLA